MYVYCRVADFFLAAGYVKGDSVAVFMTNRPEFVCVWLGLSKIGNFFFANMRPISNCK